MYHPCRTHTPERITTGAAGQPRPVLAGFAFQIRKNHCQARPFQSDLKFLR